MLVVGEINEAVDLDFLEAAALAALAARAFLGLLPACVCEGASNSRQHHTASQPSVATAK